MALLYRPNAPAVYDIRPADPDNGFSLAELYELVGCRFIEVVQLVDEGLFMVIDEHGKLTQEPYNLSATVVAAPYIGPRDYIAGNALICAPGEVT